MKKKTYRSFEEARKFAHSLKLSSSIKWYEYCKSGKKPDDIPSGANGFYKEWKGWADWLGNEYRSFAEARKFVRSLGLKNKEEWGLYVKSGKKPKDIPTNPNKPYENKGWTDWGDFLGTGSIATKKRKFRSFNEARKFARSLKLTGSIEWRLYVKSGKLPDDIPSRVENVYEKEWRGFIDFLGTGRYEYRSFAEARKFVRSLGLKSQNEWNQYRKSGKLPDDIPSRIDHIYRKQGIWKGWGDFLGTGNIATQNRIYLSAKEARIEIRKLAKEVFGGKPFTPQDWYNAHDAGKIPKNLPKILDNIYNPVSRDNRRKMEKK